MSLVLSTRPTPGGVIVGYETRSLREEVAAEVSKVLAMDDRASPNAIADRILEVPRIAAALAYLRLCESLDAASVDRSPEGGDPEEGRHAKHESAVAATSGETPNGGRNDPRD